MCKKDCFWNPSTYTCENGKHLESIISDSVVICNEIIQVTKTTTSKTVPTNFNKKR